MVYMKIHEGESWIDRSSTEPKNIENENLMSEPQIGKRQNKKIMIVVGICTRGGV